MQLVQIGYVKNVFGLNGFIYVEPTTETPEIFEELEFLNIGDRDRNIESTMSIEKIQPHKTGYMVKLENISDRTAAASFKGKTILIPMENLPKKESDEFYWFEIEGSQVFSEEGALIGTLVDYLEAGNDIFIIKTTAGKNCMISNNIEHVISIDVENKKIIVNAIGIIEEDSK